MICDLFVFPVGFGRKVVERSANDNVGQYANTNERSVRQLLDEQTNGLDYEMVRSNYSNSFTYNMDKGGKKIVFKQCTLLNSLSF